MEYIALTVRGQCSRSLNIQKLNVTVRILVKCCFAHTSLHSLKLSDLMFNYSHGVLAKKMFIPKKLTWPDLTLGLTKVLRIVEEQARGISVTTFGPIQMPMLKNPGKGISSFEDEFIR